MRAVHLGRHDGPSPRTYRDLLTLGRPWNGGTCCACHRWASNMPAGKRQMFYLGTRASICTECCERKGDEVLGPIKRAESKARHYARELLARKGNLEKEAAFYSRLAGVPEEFFREAYAVARTARRPSRRNNNKALR